jgi:hypothetical protein
MPKYIVEQISVHRTVHVVEADNEAEGLLIAEKADDNWQEWLGQMKVDVNEYSDERIAYFKNKEYFWEGVSKLDEDGYIGYIHPNGDFISRKEYKIK